MNQLRILDFTDDEGNSVVLDTTANASEANRTMELIVKQAKALTVVVNVEVDSGTELEMTIQSSTDGVVYGHSVVGVIDAVTGDIDTENATYKYSLTDSSHEVATNTCGVTLQNIDVSAIHTVKIVFNVVSGGAYDLIKATAVGIC